MQAYWAQDWVGITDFYHESVCLLLHRLVDEGASGNRAGATPVHAGLSLANKYAKTSCACESNGKRSLSTRRHADTVTKGVESKTADPLLDPHSIHHTEGRLNSSTALLPAQLLAKLDRLTRSDLRVYRVALLNFFREVKHMERKLGQRVLCDDVLQHNELELAYAFPNVTSLYYDVGRSGK